MYKLSQIAHKCKDIRAKESDSPNHLFRHVHGGSVDKNAECSFSFAFFFLIFSLRLLLLLTSYAIIVAENANPPDNVLLYYKVFLKPTTIM